MENEPEHQAAMKILLCGGIAGVISWASIYPLDVIKTRIQAEQSIDLGSDEVIRKSAWAVAKDAYRQEGAGIFFRGLGVCSVRAFIVNAVQVSPKLGTDLDEVILISVVDCLRVDDACIEQASCFTGKDCNHFTTIKKRVQTRTLWNVFSLGPHCIRIKRILSVIERILHYQIV